MSRIGWTRIGDSLPPSNDDDDDDDDPPFLAAPLTVRRTDMSASTPMSFISTLTSPPRLLPFAGLCSDSPKLQGDSLLTLRALSLPPTASSVKVMLPPRSRRDTSLVFAPWHPSINTRSRVNARRSTVVMSQSAYTIQSPGSHPVMTMGVHGSKHC
jgi:hypothetical protein